MSPNVTNVDGSFWNKTIPSNMLTLFSSSKVFCGIDFDSLAYGFDLTVFDNVPSAFANGSGKGVNPICKVSFKSMSWSFCIRKSCAKVSQSELKQQLCLLVLRLLSSLCSQRSTTYSS